MSEAAEHQMADMETLLQLYALLAAIADRGQHAFFKLAERTSYGVSEPPKSSESNFHT